MANLAENICKQVALTVEKGTADEIGQYILNHDGAYVKTTKTHVIDVYSLRPLVLKHSKYDPELAKHGVVRSGKRLALHAIEVGNGTLGDPFKLISQHVVYGNNFEQYKAGDYICSAASSMFETWSPNAGVLEDAQVSNEQAYTSRNSLKISGPMDVYLPLGLRTAHKASFCFYVPSNSCGYMNVQGDRTPGRLWALEMYFTPQGTVDLDGSNTPRAIVGTYNTNQWNQVSLELDPANGVVNVFVNHKLVAANRQFNGYIGGLNFFAAKQGQYVGEYYIDNITITPMLSIDNITITPMLSSSSQHVVTFYTAQHLKHKNFVAPDEVLPRGNALSPSSSPTFVSTTPENKNVVLEKFTGMHCGYCPDGDVQAQAIYNQNPDDVVLIAIHTGGYALPESGEPDFQTPFGSALKGQSKLTAYPQATVNRRIFDGFIGLGQNGGTAMSRGEWQHASSQILNEASYVNVAAQANLDLSTRQLSVTVEAYYTAKSPVPTNKLNVALLQNNVEGPQENATTYNPSARLPNGNYKHQHMLRHLLTGQWGDDIVNTSSGSFFTKTYTYTIPNDLNGIAYDLSNLEVAVFLTETQQNVVTGNMAAMNLIVTQGM